MNCEQATELVSLKCEQKLKLKESMQLKIHLWICPKCRYFEENNKKLRAMLKDYCQQEHK